MPTDNYDTTANQAVPGENPDPVNPFENPPEETLDELTREPANATAPRPEAILAVPLRAGHAPHG